MAMLKITEVIQKFLDEGGLYIGQDVDPEGFAGMHHTLDGVLVKPNTGKVITMGVRENAAAHVAFGAAFTTNKKIIVEAQFSDFAALFCDAIFNCSSIAAGYKVPNANITFITFVGTSEGSFEHSKSARCIYENMPNVVYIDGGYWGNQELCAKSLEQALEFNLPIVLEYHLAEIKN